ncbi:arylsulfatase [Algoriphagus boseongensis]|uniref:Arylsulfatase n=1 Tax=Algoriphagus boseongensis TaxID=1442587 RepID=A0A4R6T4X3_9BACT|nr:arylsulfatase [Algoriphagus boseongensis]TDQ17004.1 arylsulfatase [Algoriphagus boseongensis]
MNQKRIKGTESLFHNSSEYLHKIWVKDFSRILILIPVLVLVLSCTEKPSESPSTQSPNILLIVADDLAYADLGSFGGDIETPNLDQLAQEGIRFSRFHTAPLCAVTRAMLLSGNFNHVAGMGSQGLVTGIPGYEGHLSDRIAPLPALLQEAGYHTYMAGKWHLGETPETNPAKKGFEKSFALLVGAGNHFSGRGIFEEFPEAPFTENGEKTSWPEETYSTDFYTDKLISYLESNQNDGKPFFVFAAYTSPHWPLQVEEKYWKKYEGKYAHGYEKQRELNLESLKKAGMISPEAILPPLHPRVKPWDSLSPEEQLKEARKMELYAGMVDNLDHNIGRLIRYLKETGQYENTLIVFLADNGAAAEDFYYSDDYGPFLQENYTDSYEEMGKENSFISYGPQWAEAGAAPFRYFKGYTTEGGMNAPLIIAGKGVESKGKINSAFLTVMDLAPTFYELAGVAYPDSYQGKPVQKPAGESILSLLRNERDEIHDSTYVFALEHRGRALLRKGNWKLVNVESPLEVANFELYDLSKRLDEQENVKELYPEKYQELLLDWEKWSKSVGVRFPTPKPGEGL